MNLETRNASLQDLASLLTEQHAAKLDVVAPATAIRSSGGRLIINDAGDVIPDPDEGVKAGPGTFTPTAICDEGISEKLRIPVAYLRRMREERPDLYDANVNGWLHGDSPFDPVTGEVRRLPDAGPDDRKFLVRCFKGADADSGIARAFLSNGYGIYDHFDVLTAALEGIRDSGADVQVLGADLTERRMYLRVAAPAIAAYAPILLGGYRSPFEDPATEQARRHGDREIEQIRRLAAQEGQGYKPGTEPIMFAGFEISNSETGDGALVIVPRIIAEICMNGYKVTRDVLRRVHLGSKMQEGIIQWSDDTLRKNLDLVVAQTRDAVTTFLDVEYVKGVIASIEEKAGEPVAKPQETVTVVCKQLGFPPERTEGILDHFIRGGQMTAGGVMNAVTSYAQTLPNADDANEVEAQGMRALELAAAVR